MMSLKRELHIYHNGEEPERETVGEEEGGEGDEQENVRGREMEKRKRGKMRKRSCGRKKVRKSIRITKVCPLYFKDIISSLDEVGKNPKKDTPPHK